MPELDVVLQGHFDTASGERKESHASLLRAIKGSDDKPIFSQAEGVAYAVSGQTTLVRIDNGPPRGRTWNILNATIIGTDDHTPLTTNAGGAANIFAALYMGDEGMQSPGFYSPALSDVLVPNFAIPSLQTFSSKTINMNANQRMFALVYGAPAGQQIVLTVRYGEYKTSTHNAMSI